MAKSRVTLALHRAAIAAVVASSAFLFFPFAHAAREAHDGSHDFDWEVGLWNTHLKVLRHNPDGSTTWVNYEGISRVISLWNCRADMVELDAKGPDGRHIEAINLRLYNPDSHQWSLNFANADSGSMAVPSIGGFRGGIGMFYDQEAIGGREALVRGVWSKITKDSAYFVQSISDDGGKTWHPNWMAHDTRVPGTSDQCEKGRGEANGKIPAARNDAFSSQGL
jgi:hypothetical protein